MSYYDQAYSALLSVHLNCHIETMYSRPICICLNHLKLLTAFHSRMQKPNHRQAGLNMQNSTSHRHIL